MRHYDAPLQLLIEDKSGNENHLELYRQTFPNEKIRTYKNWIKNFTAAGSVYVPKRKMLQISSNCLINRDPGFLSFTLMMKAILESSEDRTQLEFISCSVTFSQFYNVMFRGSTLEYHKYFKKLMRVKFSYDLFLGISFEKLCQVFEVSAHLKHVFFENVIQEDIFYLSLLRLQKNRKDMNICLEFGNSSDVVVLGRRSRLEYIFTEILKVNSRLNIQREVVANTYPKTTLFQICLWEFRNQIYF